MALIKQANLSELAREAIVLDLGDLQRQGQRIMADARAQAARLVAEGQAERQRLLQGAAEEGRAAGLERGLAEGRAQGEKQGREAALTDQRDQIARIAVSWTTALDTFLEHRRRMLAEAQRDVIKLACAIGGRVTKRTIELDPAVVNDQLAAVLSLVMRPTRLVLGINPEDRALVETALPSLLQKFESVEHAQVVDDPSLARGSCVARIAQSGAGEIDASIGTQLDRIVESLLPGSKGDGPAKAEVAR